MDYIILSLGILFFVILVIWYAIKWVSSSRKIARMQNELGKAFIPTACAGSHYKEFPAVESSFSLQYNDFITPEGIVLDTADYDGFIIRGNSMQFCNLHTDHLVFVKKNFHISDLKNFPSVVIIHNAAAKEHECQYKVRRAWAILHGSVSDDEIRNCVNKVMTTSKYDELRQRLGDNYESDADMLSDIMDRWNKFKNTHSDSLREDIVISTTYDVDKQRIHFSIHRASSIIGVVEFRTDLKSIAA